MVLLFNTLAPEVILQVFQCLRNDHKSILSCAQTNRVCRDLAQDVALKTIYCVVDKECCKKLVECLGCNDRLRRIVRRITFTTTSHRCCGRTNVPALNITYLLFVLHFFPSIDTINATGISWDDVHTFQSPADYPITEPHTMRLHTIDFTGIHIIFGAERSFATSLHSFHSLRNVRVGSCSSLSPPPYSSTLLSPLFEKLCLELERSATCCARRLSSALNSLPHYSTLRELHIWRLHLTDITQLRNSLVSAAGSLEVLLLGFAPYSLSTSNSSAQPDYTLITALQRILTQMSWTIWALQNVSDSTPYSYHSLPLQFYIMKFLYSSAS